MDVSELRRKLVEDYGEYARSFVNIADDRIRDHVDVELKGGLLWPEPLSKLNPAFEMVEASDGLGAPVPEAAKLLTSGNSPAFQLAFRGGFRIEDQTPIQVAQDRSSVNVPGQLGTHSRVTRSVFRRRTRGEHAV